MLYRSRVILKWFVVIFMVCGLAACAPNQQHRKVQENASRANADNDNIGILLIGDSGNIEARPSESALIPVSSAIKQLCLVKQCDFGVMAGDNIYPRGADGLPNSALDADRFKRAFADPFGGLLQGSPDFRIYMALGNHDWYNSRAGALAQVAYAKATPPMYMNGFFYSLKPAMADGEVELFVIDTEMLLAAEQIQRYRLNAQGIPYKSGNLVRGGSANAIPQTAAEKQQLSWLEKALKASEAKWKIVLAHHPLWESKGSKHQQSLALRTLLRPVVCESADVYIAGHQHTLEVHSDDCEGTARPDTLNPLIHLLSGAAGKSRGLNPNYMAWQAVQFPSLNSHSTLGGVWGYMYGSVADNRFKVEVYAADKGDMLPQNYTVRYTKVFAKK